MNLIPVFKVTPLHQSLMIILLLPTVNAYSETTPINTSTNETKKEIVAIAPITVDVIRNKARYDYLAYGSTTATKTDTPLAETPQSISVVTRRHLDEREPRDIAETLAYTSGASGGYRGENLEMEMSVRGVGNKSDGGGNPVLWDGFVYQPAWEINPYMLDSVEVLKGPASVLYGKSNPGGVVNMVTKQPKGSNEKEVVLKTGTGNRIEAAFDIDNQATDKIAYRLVGAAKKMDWQTGKNAEQQSYSFAPSLLWKASDKTQLLLSGFYENEPKAGDRNFLLRKGVMEPVNGKYLPYDFFGSDPNFHDLHNKKAHINTQLTHQFNDNLSFEQKIHYGKYNDYLKSLIMWDTGKDSEIIRKARIFDIDSNNTQIDNQLIYKNNFGKTAHTFNVGVDYLKLEERTKSSLGAAPSIDWQNPHYGVTVTPPPQVSDDDNKNNQLGVYLQDQIQYNSWHFLLGGRYDHTKLESNDRQYKSQQDQTDHKFTWRTGALYEFDNGLSPYVSYSTSFLPELGVDANGKSLIPTTATQAELGLKYKIKPNVLLTTSIFSIDQKNITVRDPVTFQKSQLGKIRTKGAEVELQGDITPRWGISGSYTYLDKKVKEDNNPQMIGKTQWGVPKQSASLWTDYRFKNQLSGLSVGTGIRYVGESWGDNQNTFKVPSYALWDIKLAYKPDNLFPALKGTNIQLNVQNATNKHYVASCANDYACFYGKERQYILSAGYRW